MVTREVTIEYAEIPAKPDPEEKHLPSGRWMSV
jgi:hypothetical protein